MSFLAPLFLLGTAAVALPVVFHLIRRNTRQRTPFSSLLFLQPTPPRMRQRSRLEDLLLLALRCAVIALLALGFARPFLPRDVFADPTAAPGQRLVVLVDTSASMQRAGWWDAALRQVTEALQATQPHDQVALLAFGVDTTPLVSFEAWSAAPLEGRAALALDRLKTAGPGWSGTHLDQALIHAADLLLEGGDDRFQGERRIVLVSDLQDGARLDRLQSYDWPRQISLSIRPLSATRTGNAGLQLLGDTAPLPGATNTTVRVRVSNGSDSRNDRLELVWGRAGSGEPGGTATEVRLAPGGSRVVPLEVPAGTEVDRVQLRGDDEPFDNTLFLVPPVPASSRILYLGTEDPSDSQQPLFFLRRAFPQTNSVGVTVDARRPDVPLDEAGLKNVGLIIAGNGLPESQAIALRQLAEAGRTVLFVVRDAAAGGAASLARLLDLPNLNLEEVRPPNYALLGGVDLRHPLLAAFADPRFSDFTKIRVWRYRRLALDALPGLRVPLRFESGDPALAELSVGRGRLVILTMGWQPTDSQLAVSSKFVPLLYALLEAGGPGLPTASVPRNVGDPLPLPEPAGPEARIRRPDGSERPVPAGATQITDTSRPGIYLYNRDAAAKPIRFAVNLDPAESRTSPLAVEDLERLGPVLRPASAVITPTPERARQLAATEAEGRQKLWRWALLATLLFILAETALAGRLTRLATPSAGTST